MAAERHARQEVLREAQAVIDNAEWNSLTRAEQDAQIARQDAEYQAHFDEMIAEAKAEAAMDAALDDPEIG